MVLVASTARSKSKDQQHKCCDAFHGVLLRAKVQRSASRHTAAYELETGRGRTRYGGRLRLEAGRKKRPPIPKPGNGPISAGGISLCPHTAQPPIINIILPTPHSNPPLPRHT